MNTHGPAFNAVHVSALWVHLGRLARKHRAERVWQERNEVRIIQARDLTLRLLPTLGPRQLANAAHGAAASGVQNLPSWSTFWDRFGSASVRLLRDFKMNELKNVLWAFATAKAGSPRLFEQAALVLSEHMHELTPAEISMVAWSYAVQDHPAPALLSGLAVAAEARMDEFPARELSSMAFALARADCPAPSFFAALSTTLPDRREEFAKEPDALVSTAWGLGRAGVATPAVLEVLAEAVCRSGRKRKVLAHFQPWSLTRLVLPYALCPDPMGEYSYALIDAVAAEAVPRMQEFSIGHLSRLARAYAIAQSARRISPKPELFRAIAAAAVREMGRAESKELSTMAWAFGTCVLAPTRTAGATPTSSPAFPSSRCISVHLGASRWTSGPALPSSPPCWPSCGRPPFAYCLPERPSPLCHSCPPCHGHARLVTLGAASPPALAGRPHHPPSSSTPSLCGARISSPTSRPRSSSPSHGATVAYLAVASLRAAPIRIPRQRWGLGMRAGRRRNPELGGSSSAQRVTNCSGSSPRSSPDVARSSARLRPSVLRAPSAACNCQSRLVCRAAWRMGPLSLQA